MTLEQVFRTILICARTAEHRPEMFVNERTARELRKLAFHHVVLCAMEVEVDIFQASRNNDDNNVIQAIEAYPRALEALRYYATEGFGQVPPAARHVRANLALMKPSLLPGLAMEARIDAAWARTAVL